MAYGIFKEFCPTVFYNFFKACAKSKTKTKTKQKTNKQTNKQKTRFEIFLSQEISNFSYNY